MDILKIVMKTCPLLLKKDTYLDKYSEFSMFVWRNSVNV